VAASPGVAVSVAHDVIRSARTPAAHVHLANAYSLALSSRADRLRTVFNGGICFPDGKPVVWASRLLGHRDPLRQVRGPQFFRDVLSLDDPDVRHYLIGGRREVLVALRQAIERDYPMARVVGAESPPFRELSHEEIEEMGSRVRASRANVIWVGLGTPKQDIFAERMASYVSGAVIAIGAAFDFTAGTTKEAPHWVSAVGFEWLYRLCSEPRRLWRRYTVGSLQFAHAVWRFRKQS
jgi:N-acetylglucosaminyldiphosphoundecaprenol N-acetyl-beta-D-mannosaminyltransferase